MTAAYKLSTENAVLDRLLVGTMQDEQLIVLPQAQGTELSALDWRQACCVTRVSIAAADGRPGKIWD
jgi:hypothetical protein